MELIFIPFKIHSKSKCWMKIKVMPSRYNPLKLILAFPIVFSIKSFFIPLDGARSQLARAAPSIKLFSFQTKARSLKFIVVFSFFSVASYLKDLLKESGIVLDKKCAIVQTAYANGSSTEYITNTLVSEPL